ncbi:MAG: serine/threonine-protein kinase, partial [Pirellulales bacterium]
MNAHATTPDDRQADGKASAERAQGMKFTYASGAKPLSGYTIKRGIGRGGFGEVYYAVSDGGKEVALKLIRRNFDIELRGVAHCLNLKHPNLLGLHDVRTDDHDDHWVVMEFVTGQSLEDVIAANPAGVPPQEAGAWMHGIAAGVGYLHQCGIVHRDLKPGNIFSDQGLVKIGDYGLSKFVSCSRRSGQTESVGTVHYMAPEIANGRYGKEIDVYAIGIMFYEMLTGCVPFEGESIGEVLMKHLTAEPDLSVLDEPYRSIVRRCLVKDPDLRYRTVEELIADLPEADPATSRVHQQPRVAAAPVAAGASATGTKLNAEKAARAVDAEVVPPRPVITAEPVIEEPIWRWTKSTFSEFGYAFNNNLSTVAKVVLIVIGVWTLLLTATVVVPATMCVVFVYLIYRAIWGLVTWQGFKARRDAYRSAGARSATAEHGVTQAAQTGARRQQGRRQSWPASGLAVSLPVRTPRERMMGLSGSLVLSGLVCLVISVVMLMLRGQISDPQQYAWLALTSIIGSWGILVPAKIWEGGQGEATLRRFFMLVVGIGVGLAACGLQR